MVRDNHQQPGMAIILLFGEPKEIVWTTGCLFKRRSWRCEV